MDEPHTQRFLIVENDTKYSAWLQHAIGAGWPSASIVVMDWSSFARVRTAMTVRDYDIVMLALEFDEGIEDPTFDSLDWIRKLRSQPGFPEMIVLATAGSELAAIRTLRLGASDYLPKRLLTPPRLQRSIKLTLRAIEKEAIRRAERAAQAAAQPGTAVSATDDRNDNASMSLPGGRPHIATHTGAALTEAARRATAVPAAISTPAPVSTQAGSALAAAARAVVSPPTSPSVPARVEAASRDPAAASLPAAANPEPALSASNAMAPTQGKDSQQVAPDHHHIPGYSILQRIGESEAAAVYLAIAKDLGHNVALKVSKRKHSASESASDTGQRQILFQREFEAIAALDHPSIIDLFDYGIHEGVEYLAMEYFPCGDLKARLQNPLTADEAIAFLKEIARSLKVVHEADIIHRDLKPPNVMLRADGSVVLIDFGLARSVLSGDGSTRTGVLRGSPYYMSPEQAQGENLDARTDLYSLGVMLYEMLAGKKPYLGASAIDVLQQHVMAPVPELPVHHLFYQPLLERLMSKSREQRIATCDELLAMIERMEQPSEGGLFDPAAFVESATT